jgi:hypothetical protein
MSNFGRPMWTLDEALEVIRALQPITRDYSYHLALGGGVLNKGTSDKDLDLYFLPLDNGSETKPNELAAYLDEIWGVGEPIGGEGYQDMEGIIKRKYKYGRDARIDAFIFQVIEDENG